MANEPLEMKKQIIKNIITPFFKNNGFTKKGTKYIKNINHVIIIADIQSQRYYKEKTVENFRINIRIHPDNTNDSSETFWIGHIDFSETSWITIYETTDIEELKVRLNLSRVNSPPLWGVKLGVRGICSPAYAKISRKNLQYPAACGGDSLLIN